MINRALRLLIAISCLLTATAMAHASITLHGPNHTDQLGTYTLLEDTPGQLITIYATSDDQPVQGINLNAQIGDGLSNAPSFTSVDLLAGTIFETNNTGLGSASGVLTPQVAFYSTTTAIGTVLANGLLATIEIDTSGFFASDGPFDLILSQTLNNPTNFGPITPTIIDGAILLSSIALPGDFNASGSLDTQDLTALYNGFGQLAFDLTDDQQTDADDLQAWVETLYGSRLGDTNLDRRVDLIDLSQLASNFGTTTTTYEQADFNGDRTVDLIDLSLLATSFGFDGSQATLGDVNNDGQLNVDDIELIYQNLGDPNYDQDGDADADANDLAYWVVTYYGSRLGDANLDRAIDLIDLSILAGNFGAVATNFTDADFNSDGLIDLIDLSQLAANFGFTAVVPEPLSILPLALIILIRQRDLRDD
ncbi:MAG: hypothetical protein RIG82_11085 [Phycisphaeraceae bacterium]